MNHMYITYYHKADMALSELFNAKISSTVEKTNEWRDRFKNLKDRMIQGNYLYQRKRYDLSYELFNNIKNDCKELFKEIESMSLIPKDTKFHIEEYCKDISFLTEIIKSKNEVEE